MREHAEIVFTFGVQSNIVQKETVTIVNGLERG